MKRKILLTFVFLNFLQIVSVNEAFSQDTQAESVSGDAETWYGISIFRDHAPSEGVDGFARYTETSDGEYVIDLPSETIRYNPNTGLVSCSLALGADAGTGILRNPRLGRDADGNAVDLAGLVADYDIGRGWSFNDARLISGRGVSAIVTTHVGRAKSKLEQCIRSAESAMETAKLKDMVLADGGTPNKGGSGHFAWSETDGEVLRYLRRKGVPNDEIWMEFSKFKQQAFSEQASANYTAISEAFAAARDEIHAGAEGIEPDFYFVFDAALEEEKQRPPERPPLEPLSEIPQHLLRDPGPDTTLGRFDEAVAAGLERVGTDVFSTREKAMFQRAVRIGWDAAVQAMLDQERRRELEFQNSLWLHNYRETYGTLPGPIQH